LLCARPPWSSASPTLPYHMPTSQPMYSLHPLSPQLDGRRSGGPGLTPPIEVEAWWLCNGGGQGQHQRHPLAVCKGREAGTDPRLPPCATRPREEWTLVSAPSSTTYVLACVIDNTCLGRRSTFTPHVATRTELPALWCHHHHGESFSVGPGGRRPRSYIAPSPCCMG
jgi:hypothetical protein